MAPNDKRQNDLAIGRSGGHTRAVHTIRGHELIVLKSPLPSQRIDKEMSQKQETTEAQKKHERQRRRLRKNARTKKTHVEAQFFSSVKTHLSRARAALSARGTQAASVILASRPRREEFDEKQREGRVFARSRYILSLFLKRKL